MKTAEKILWNNGVGITDHISSSAYDATIKAMEEYTEQQAIEFSEWVGRRYMRYATGWVPNWKRGPYKEENILTTETLYQKFKEEQK